MKHWYTLFLLLAGLFVMQAARAEEATAVMTRKILLPDGKPAAGVKVIFRTISRSQERLLQEAEVTTDADGVAAKEMTYEKLTVPMPTPQYGYLIVDAPGYALAFGQFQIAQTDESQPATVYFPLTLTPAYEEMGTVVDAASNAPIAGATVSVMAFGSNPLNGRMLINVPNAGMQTPAMTAVSGIDGTFHLRGVTTEFAPKSFRFNGKVDEAKIGRLNEMAQRRGFRDNRTTAKASASLTASAKVGGKVYSGGLASYTFGSTLPNPPKLVLALSPAVAVSGHVVHALTRKPLSGVTVTLYGDPSTAVKSLSTATTDATGTYTFPTVPGVRQLFAVATCPDFGDGYIRIYPHTEMGSAEKPLSEDATAADIALRPMTTISGKIVDEVTGKSPVTEMHISAIYSEGYDDGSIAVGRRGANTTAALDGTFTLRIPVGISTAYVTGTGYRTHFALDVTPGNFPCREYKVQHEQGIFIKFNTADPQKLQRVGIQVRKAPDAPPVNTGGNIDKQGYWYMYPNFLGNDPITEVEIRLINSNNEEVLPWTKITRDPKVWPLVITIP